MVAPRRSSGRWRDHASADGPPASGRIAETIGFEKTRIENDAPDGRPARAFP
jgi:hypothetical protein